MCIAILNKNGVLSDDELENCWDYNNDGAGFCYFTGDGKMVLFKEVFNFEAFKKEYIKHRKANLNTPFLVHFRISTQGNIDEKNCHPHVVNKELAFIHNGILSDYSSYQTGLLQSDTVDFNEKVLQAIDITFTPTISLLLGEIIGRSNKLVFLAPNDEYMIVNEEIGHWKGGNWYSNGSYKFPAQKELPYYCDDYGYDEGVGGHWDDTGHWITSNEDDYECEFYDENGEFVTKDWSEMTEDEIEMYWDTQDLMAEQLYIKEDRTY